MEAVREINNPSISFRNRDGYSIILSTFSGRVNLSVFHKEDKSQRGRGRSVQRITLNEVDLLYVRRIVDNMPSMSPETQKALNIRTRNQESGNYEVVGAICFGKDEKQVYYVELQFKKDGRSHSIRCETVMYSTLQPTEVDFSPAQASADGVSVMKWFLDTVVPLGMVCANYKFEQDNNRGGGNNNNSPSF